MKPSEKCKAAGLKSLVELAEITGRTSKVLIDWAKNEPAFFDIVLRGAVVTKLTKVLGS